MYVVGPGALVKGENNWDEYLGVLRELQQKTIERAGQIWEGYSFGGIMPGDRQFGMTNLRPEEMAHDVTASSVSGTASFRKSFTATGWTTLFDYVVRDDTVHGLAGFNFPDETLRITKLRWEIGDRKFPIIDVQEAIGWGSFHILFKADQGKELVATEKQRVYVRGYVEATGSQRIIPVGLMLYRRIDLVISE